MAGVTFFIQTFGCKSNQYESQAIREALLAAGLRETEDVSLADVAIVNTCGVTGRAGASCRNAVRKIRRINDHARLVLTGCAVDLGEAWPQIPGPEPVCVPNAKKHHIAGVVRGCVTDIGEVAEDRLALSISSFHGHTRAFLKVQDGCDNFCSYCAVPFARGVPVSRPVGEVLEEAKRLVGAGHREVVLTGINIGAYECEGVRLGELALELSGVPGLERLRLGSVEPPYVSENLVRAMAGSGVICPHVHVPLQSGDDGVLEAMGRRYSTAEFLEKIAMLREGVGSGVAVTTDVIVGFPGETEGAWERTRGVCEAAGFSRMHVFLFSPRPGTRAAEMKRTARDGEIEAWKRGLIRLGEELASRFAAGCVGGEERVIFERGGVGLTDRYLRVRVRGEETVSLAGEVGRVRIVGSEGEDLLGERIVSGALRVNEAPKYS